MLLKCSANSVKGDFQACLFLRSAEDCTLYMQPESTEIPLNYKLLAWFDAHQKQAITGAIVAVVLGVIVSFVFYMQGQKSGEASTEFSKLMFQQTATPESFLQLATKYTGTGGGANALLQGAQSLFAAGKYPEAQAQFEQFRSAYRKNPLAGTASMGIAACLDAQGKADEALAIYEELIARHPTDMIFVQSQFAAARLYESKKQFDKAIQLYQAVGSEDRQGRMGEDAAVRAHELSVLHPAPVAPVAEAPLLPSTLK